MRGTLMLLPVVACGANPTAAPPLGPLSNVGVPAPPVAAVRAEDLAAPDVVAGLESAVRLRPGAMARLFVDGPTLTDDPRDVDAALRFAVWSVLELRDDAVRILEASEDALLAVWVARDALAPAITRQVAVETSGIDDQVALRPGAAVAPGPGPGELALVHPAIQLRGRVAPDAIGAVFPWRRDQVPLRSDGRAGPGVLRATPDALSPTLLQLADSVEVRRLGAGGAWVEVEILDAVVAARGFVEAAAYAPGWMTIGTGRFATWGGSHRVTVDVPRGACLYAETQDEVVGVTVADERASLVPLDGPWFELRASTSWGWASLRVRDVAPAGASTPRAEVCPRTDLP